MQSVQSVLSRNLGDNNRIKMKIKLNERNPTCHVHYYALNADIQGVFF